MTKTGFGEGEPKIPALPLFVRWSSERASRGQLSTSKPLQLTTDFGLVVYRKSEEHIGQIGEIVPNQHIIVYISIYVYIYILYIYCIDIFIFLYIQQKILKKVQPNHHVSSAFATSSRATGAQAKGQSFRVRPAPPVPISEGRDPSANHPGIRRCDVKKCQIIPILWTFHGKNGKMVYKNGYS